MPICIFLDRGFGVSSAPALEFAHSPNPTPGHNQRITYVTFGKQEDSDALYILGCMEGPGLVVQVLAVDTEISPPQRMSATRMTMETLTEIIFQYGPKDLLVVGWSNAQSSWVTGCKCSVMLVHSPKDQSIVTLVKEESSPKLAESGSLRVVNPRSHVDGTRSAGI